MLVPAPSAPLACKHLTHPGPGTREPAQAAILPGSFTMQRAQLLHWLLSKELEPLYTFIPS